MKTHRNNVAAILFLSGILLVGISAFAQAQYASFLHIDGVEGESRNEEHVAWIEVLGYEFGVGPAEDGTVRQGPRPFTELVIFKSVDKASPRLLDVCVKGQRFNRMILSICRDMASSPEILKVELGLPTVVSVDLVAKDGHAAPMERVRFSFRNIQVIYTQRDQMGRPRGDVEMHWEDAGIHQLRMRQK